MSFPVFSCGERSDGLLSAHAAQKLQRTRHFCGSAALGCDYESAMKAGIWETKFLSEHNALRRDVAIATAIST
jgi:hypothetical protein